jgi:hypothetical protein
VDSFSQFDPIAKLSNEMFAAMPGGIAPEGFYDQDFEER